MTKVVFAYERQDKIPRWPDPSGNGGYRDPFSHSWSDPHIRCTSEAVMVQGCGARNLRGKWPELKLNHSEDSTTLVGQHTRTLTLRVGGHVY